MNTIRIIAAVLDVEKLILYKEDGETIEIRQGDPRVALVIDQSADQLATQGYADVSLDLANPETNVYREFENLVKGTIRFFRVHKDKIGRLFEELAREDEDVPPPGSEPHLTPVVLGVVPTNGLTPTSAPNQEAPRTGDVSNATTARKPSRREAIDEIMSQAQPVSDPDFTSAGTTEDHTMVAALTDDEGEPVVVPGMEHLQAQLNHAVKLGTPEGATNFVRRLTAVIHERRHTIDELLNFMSRGDLPIADDGSIVSYKVLKTLADTPKGYYVDCYTKKVLQRIGSYVTQANVDESRRTECSTGLHIARRGYLRGYLRGFYGNVIVLVKVRPEDVMAVPQSNPDKMRVRGYHVLSEVPAEDHAMLRNNKPMGEGRSRKLLTMALRGEHVGVLETVAIGGPKGTDVVVTRHDQPEGAKKAPRHRKSTPETESVEVDGEQKIVAPVDVKETSDRVVQSKTQKEPATRLVTEQRRLFEARDFGGLYALKKSKKKGWGPLGFTEEETRVILDNDPSKPGRMSQEEQASQEQLVSSVTPVVEQVSEADEPKKVEKPKKTKIPKTPETPEVDLSSMNRKQKALHYLSIVNSERRSRAERRQAYQDLIAHKKASKVGWGVLGIDDFDAVQAKMEG